MQVGLGGYFQQSWLVLLLAVALSGSLAMVDRALQPRIERHAEARLRAAILEVVPGGSESELVERGGVALYRVTDERGGLVGWAVPAESMGFADQIRLMIGLDAAAREITGLVVVGSRETPGLGERIRSPEFRQRFVGKPADATLKVVKPGESAEYPIEAITGATISSQAVTDGVNDQLAAVRAALASSGPSSEPASVSPEEPEEIEEVVP